MLFRDLHREEEEEVQHQRGAAQVASLSGRGEADVAYFAAMFPALDPELIRTMLEELPTVQHALETLLALSAATCDLASAGDAPDQEMGVEDHDRFPTLVDSEGWQVAGKHQFDLGPDLDLSSAWCDRARAAASMPAPRASRLAVAPAPVSTGPRRSAGLAEQEEEELEGPIDEYDLRHAAGQRRIRHRARFAPRRLAAAAAGSGGGGARGGLVGLPCGVEIGSQRDDMPDLESVASEATEASFAVC